METIKRLKLAARPKRYLDIHIVDHCDLNCKGCAHFSSISDDFFIDVRTLEDSYKKLNKIYKKFFNSIHLLGGEPTLHPELEKILLLTRNYFPNIEIQLVTNGLRLSRMSDIFWKTCKDCNIKIYISKYPVHFNYDVSIQACRNNHVQYEISEFRNDFIHHVLDDNGTQNPYKSYRKCKYGGECVQLRDNKLYPCAQSAYIDIFNKRFNKNFSHCKKDYLELDRLKYRWQMFLFLFFARPFCRYCNLTEEHFEKWDISKRTENEWGNK